MNRLVWQNNKAKGSYALSYYLLDEGSLDVDYGKKTIVSIPKGTQEDAEKINKILESLIDDAYTDGFDHGLRNA